MNRVIRYATQPRRVPVVGVVLRDGSVVSMPLQPNGTLAKLLRRRGRS